MNESCQVIPKIKEILLRYSHIKYEEKEGVIRVEPDNENGFPVEIWDKDSRGEFTVFGLLWHHHFLKEDQAIDCFMSCLTNTFRLKIASRGKKDVSASVEIFDGNNWCSKSMTGIFHFNFFEKKSIRYLQNNWILTDKGKTDLFRDA